MILDLIEGIKQVLKEEWNIPIHTEGFKELEAERPSFSIFIPSSEEKPLMGDRCVRQVMADIKYHPNESSDFTQCYSVAERLFEVTNFVSLPNGGNVMGQNRKFEFAEKEVVFHVSFDFIMTVKKEIDEEKLMGTIDSQTTVGVEMN